MRNQLDIPSRLNHRPRPPNAIQIFHTKLQNQILLSNPPRSLHIPIHSINQTQIMRRLKRHSSTLYTLHLNSPKIIPHRQSEQAQLMEHSS